MKSKLLYLLCGTAIGAGSHYAYRFFNPERNINSATKDIVSTFVSNHNLQQGYVISVLKSLSLMLHGFYHYGMDNKIKGFNFNSTYIRRDELENPHEQIKHLYCIFSPNEYLCGHPQIQHGGATATIIDQNMGYLSMLYSKDSVATKTLSIDYKRPVKKDQYYVLEMRVTKRQGRKIWVKGVIKQLQTGQIKVQSEGLFYTVAWDNQMSRVLKKFFQAVDFKQFRSQHDGHTTPPDYNENQDALKHLVYGQKPASQNVENTGQGSSKLFSKSQKLEEIRSLKQSMINKNKETKEYDQKIQKLTALVEQLEKNQNLIPIHIPQKNSPTIEPHAETNSKAEFIS